MSSSSEWSSVKLTADFDVFEENVNDCRSVSESDEVSCKQKVVASIVRPHLFFEKRAIAFVMICIFTVAKLCSG